MGGCSFSIKNIAYSEKRFKIIYLQRKGMTSDRCGRWMEGKKRVVPREVCAERSEKSNRYCEITLNAQKSAEVIVAEFLGEGPNQ